MLKLRTLYRGTSSNPKPTDGEPTVEDNDGVGNAFSDAWRRASDRSASDRTNEIEPPVTMHPDSHTDGYELLKKYERWLSAADSQGPNRKTCPRCGDITEVDLSVLKVSKLAKCGIPVRCVECQLDWCFLCHAPMHTGITCKAFRAGDKQLKQWAAYVRNSGDCNAQRCPKCKVYIERSGGCDHMVCSRCDTKFCYRCGHRRRKLKIFNIKLEDHDSKLSIFGCSALYKKNNPAQRRLARGAIVGGKVIGGTAAVAVGVPLLVGLAGVAVGVAVVALPAFGIYRLVRHIRHR